MVHANILDLLPCSHRRQFRGSDDNAQYCQAPDIGQPEQNADGKSDEAEYESSGQDTLSKRLKLRLCGLTSEDISARRAARCRAGDLLLAFRA